MPHARQGRALRILVFQACALPAVLVAWDAFRGALGANPIAEAMNRLGFWALFFLLLSLAPTPLKTLFSWTSPIRFRRMLGLFAFFYAACHFVSYFAIDQFFDLQAILRDVTKRKFITVGFAAFAALLPLALTSTDRSVRRMGFVRWKLLHRLSYGAALLGVVHFAWRVKADLRQPMLFALALSLLLGIRLLAVGKDLLRDRDGRGLEKAKSGPQSAG